MTILPSRTLMLGVIAAAACTGDEPLDPLASCVRGTALPATGPTIEIDVGSDDGPYTPQRGFGWLGTPTPVTRPSWSLGFPIGGAGESTVFATFAHGITGYRVDVPDGLYDVTLWLREPEFPEPGMRVFDVIADGVTLVDDLDLAALAGQDEAAAITVEAASQGG